MSGGTFHVHGPHGHEVEHQGQSGDQFAGRLAVMTAILATLGAVFSYQGSAEQNAALLAKNEQAIKRTEASDQWNFYQAKSSKQNLAELALALTTGEPAENYRKEVARYKAEKEEIMPKARALETAAEEAGKRSDAAMHVHHRWAQATTMMQIAISLAAITLLTRKRWLQYVAYGTGAAGVVVAGLALAHI